MSPILAQADTAAITPGDIRGSALIVLVGLLLNALFKWQENRRTREKDKRESDLAELKEKREQFNQERLANAFERTEEKIGELVTHLATQAKLNDDRHAANIDAIKNTCKAHCTNYQLIHGPKNPGEK